MEVVALGLPEPADEPCWISLVDPQANMMEKSTMKIKTKWVSSTSPSKVATQMNFVDQTEVLKQCTSEPSLEKITRTRLHGDKVE